MGEVFKLNHCYNMDCLPAMELFPDNYFDLAVVDPPYFSGPERRGFYGSKVSKIGVHRDYPVSPAWSKPEPEYFKELFRVCRHYCHPYSSWERGSNENVNGMIRRRHPKGTDFSKVTAEEIAATENWINSYPRKIFGYKSAGTMFRECLRELGLTA